MANEILSYIEMCQRERCSLQRGMNFGLGGNHSVILMSVHPNAPYRDRLENDGSTLIYEGHDLARAKEVPNPKSVDQPETTITGRLTQNGIFYQAADAYKRRERPPERVRVYEKIREGIWSYNGVFHLEDAWKESDSVSPSLQVQVSRSKRRRGFIGRTTRESNSPEDYSDTSQARCMETGRWQVRSVWCD